MHFTVIGLNGDKLNVCWSKCQPCNESVTYPRCTLLLLGKRPKVADRVTSWEICSTLFFAFEWKGSRTAVSVSCSYGSECKRFLEISNNIWSYQKTQCSSNTNWTAAECGRLKLTMQYLGDWVNSITQLIFKAHLKMIFCCSFTTAHIATVAIFCPTALNSVLQTPSA